MSVRHSGQAEEDSATEEVAPSAPSATRDIYKQKPASKVVRVLTVLAYLLSVSLAAILLSVYYVCVWRSPEISLEPVDAVEASARRDNHTQHQVFQRYQQPLPPSKLQHFPHVERHATHEANPTGGGNTTVIGDVAHSTSDNITGAFTEDVTEPSLESSSNATVLSDADIALRLNGSSQFNETDNVT